MAVRRTRQDKVTAQLKRETVTYAFSATEDQTLSAPTTPPVQHPSTAFFGYPTKLIYQDLVRSLVVTVIILVLLLAITWRLHT